jgi:energy-converting hydrogenase A subunit R
MPHVVCFDLEGPLSPQDNAYEVMGLFENGLRIFETISRYDDLLALEGREDYEAGDTLMLIAPFLVYHCITEDDIKQVSKKAMLVEGARDLISELKKNGFEPDIISTSYEQHAHNIGWQLGVALENISCTKFPLDRYIMDLGEEDSGFIARVEQDILDMYPPINDMKVKMRLDKFFFSELPSSPFGKIMDKMSVVGGARKVVAAERISELHEIGLADLVVIGDSITDFRGPCSGLQRQPLRHSLCHSGMCHNQYDGYVRHSENMESRGQGCRDIGLLRSKGCDRAVHPCA